MCTCKRGNYYRVLLTNTQQAHIQGRPSPPVSCIWVGTLACRWHQWQQKRSWPQHRRKRYRAGNLENKKCCQFAFQMHITRYQDQLPASICQYMQCGCWHPVGWGVVSVPDPKPTPAQIGFSIALYWKQYTHRMRSGDETRIRWGGEGCSNGRALVAQLQAFRRRRFESWLDLSALVFIPSSTYTI